MCLYSLHVATIAALEAGGCLFLRRWLLKFDRISVAFYSFYILKNIKMYPVYHVFFVKCCIGRIPIHVSLSGDMLAFSCCIVLYTLLLHKWWIGVMFSVIGESFLVRMYD
jgi:hypothetical protein